MKYTINDVKNLIKENEQETGRKVAWININKEDFNSLLQNIYGVNFNIMPYGKYKIDGIKFNVGDYDSITDGVNVVYVK